MKQIGVLDLRSSVEYSCNSFRCNGIHNGEEVDHFGELIYNGNYSILAFRLGKRADEINRNDFPGAGWDFIWA